MNSTHDANRGNQGQSTRGRGRGRGRGLGRGQRRREEPGVISGRSTFHPIPTIQQVLPGAPVSIVLKIDQPTGHEVQGLVAEVLTKGNHPRGIKVRLQDGRVGRVQAMALMALIETGPLDSPGLSGQGRTGRTGEEGVVAPESNQGIQTSNNPTPVDRPMRHTDYRVDGGEAPPAAELSLMDYIVVKTKGKKGKGPQSHDPNEETVGEERKLEDTPSKRTATSVCPVCKEFEGDEVAVAHHVNSHFD